MMAPTTTPTPMPALLAVLRWPLPLAGEVDVEFAEGPVVVLPLVPVVVVAEVVEDECIVVEST